MSFTANHFRREFNHLVYPQDYLKALKKYTDYTGKSPFVAFLHVLEEHVNKKNMKNFALLGADLNQTLYQEKENTLSQNFTKIRKAIKGAMGFEKMAEVPDEVLEILRPKKEQRKARKKTADERRTAKNDNVTNVADADTRRVFDQLAEKHNPSFADNVLMLMLGTGRRLIEVLRVAKISEAKKAGWVHFDGLAKEKEGLEHVDELDAPLIMFENYKQMEDMWKDVRDKIERDGYDFKTDTIDEETDARAKVTKKYRQRVADKMKTQFKGILPKDQITKTHSLRKLYGSIAIQNVKSHNRTAANFLTDILGHQKGKDTHKSYENITVVSEFPSKTQGDVKNSLDLLNRKIDAVDDRLDELDIEPEAFFKYERLFKVSKIIYKSTGSKPTHRRLARDSHRGSTIVSYFLRNMWPHWKDRIDNNQELKVKAPARQESKAEAAAVEEKAAAEKEEKKGMPKGPFKRVTRSAKTNEPTSLVPSVVVSPQKEPKKAEKQPAKAENKAPPRRRSARLVGKR